ncbi:hypothetical protein BH23GEM5_BH23GEM5_26040 [soil metagenome]
MCGRCVQLTREESMRLESLSRKKRGGALLAALFVLGATLSACDHTTVAPADAEQGPSFRATWAGSRWEGDASAMLIAGGTAGDTLYVLGTNPVNAGQLPISAVRVKVVFRGAGTYPLGPGAAEVIHLVGGDVVSAQYTTRGSVGTAGTGGTLTVREYGAGWVSGSVVFDAVTTRQSAPYGSTARFDGEFRARVQQRL